jgi:Tol biopolymer transport system component
MAPTKCGFPLNTAFTVRVSIDQLDLSDLNGNTIAGYTGFQALLNSTVGLPYKNRVGFGEFFPAGGGPLLWPECAAFNENKGPNNYVGGCLSAINPTVESLYTGVVLEVDYTCSSTGTISLVHGLPYQTLINSDLFPAIANDPSGASENLQINCLDPKASFRVAYAGTDPNELDGEIFTMRPDGSDKQPLTVSGPGVDEYDPAWSPNGTKIAFASNAGAGGDSDIHTINVDGTGETPLTSDPAADTEPVWSPDGSKIAFVSDRHDPNGEIYSIPSSGGASTRLTNNAATDVQPTWSPDGATIAFMSTRDDVGGEIYVMNADGSGTPTRLTSNSGVDYQPDWSNGGTKIAFVSNRDGNEEIYTMNVDGSAQTRRTSNIEFDWNPTWKADDTEIIFSRGVAFIHRMKADGTNVVDISSGQQSLVPDWRRVSGGLSADYGGDGCTDAKEAHSNQVIGGRRNPQSYWDFFDVWVQTSPGVWTRNKVIDTDEIFGIAARAFTVGSPAGNPLTPPVSKTGYHVAYDRTGEAAGMDAWDLRAPDGAIGVDEIFWAADQIFHSCA